MKASALYPLLCVLRVVDAAVTVVTVTAAPSIPSNAPQYTNTDLFTSAIINSTNFYRAEHNASDVTWNKTLADFASDYLDSDGCDFKHSGGPYGENLAMGYANATAGVEAWGNEVAKYSFSDPGFAEDTGHFTQLVWKNTTTVGCDRKLCGTSGWFLVCEYWPRGNVLGEFGDQVDKGDSAAVRERPRAWAMVVVLVVACMLCWV